MAPKEEPWSLVIGQVTAPFGTAGAVRVRPETDFPERFRELEEVCLGLPDGEDRILRVGEVRLTPKGLVVTFAGCHSRTDAESLRRAWVKVKPSMAVPLPEGKYWVHEIIGLRVLTEEGEDLGEVSEVVRTRAHDIYVTPRTMIPAVREIIRKVDLDEGMLVVSLPAGHEIAPQEAEG